MQYPPTELVLNSQGRVYHLDIAPGQVAEKIILVGDQDRVEMVAAFFDRIDHSSRHREFNCITGSYQGKGITALSTGIGTDNIDIVMNELDAVFNIDLEKREDRKEIKKLEIVRIGTCGILQKEIPVHSFILSSHAFGMDNVGHFYLLNFTDEEEELNSAIQAHIGLPSPVKTYTVKVSGDLVEKLSSAQTFTGITITSSGFYGPQGRQLRLSTRTNRLNEAITSFRFNDHQIMNFEMESSALFAIGKGLGHHCATICLGIANRPNLEFSSGYAHEMNTLIRYVLDRI